MRLALLGCIAFAACGAVFAVPFMVNTTNDTQDVSPGDSVCIDSNGMCSLRAAISESNALAGDDIIDLPAGIYTRTLGVSPFLPSNENANAAGDLDITSSITINGAGSGSTFIQAATSAGSTNERVLHINASSAPNSAVVVINGVTLRYGRYHVIDYGGSGLRIEGTGANVTLNNVVIRENQEYLNGAGIYVTTGMPLLTLNNCFVINNSITASSTDISATGGGININSGSAIINNTTISGNTVTSSDSATYGAGIALRGGTLDLINSTVSNNRAFSTPVYYGIAGGIYNREATLNIINSTVSGNTADIHTGIRTLAINTAAITNINNSAILNNTADYGEGGGVANIATGTANSILNLNNTTVSRNSAIALAGGIYNNFANNSGLAITNINFSTISENFIDSSSGEGGGIVNFRHAPEEQNVSTLRLKNSVVANNKVGINGFAPDIEGFFESQGYNLIKNPQGAWFVPTEGDVIRIDPLLGALGLNGGTTLNYLPNPNSPLIDRIPNGVNGCGGFDQRGVSRPADSDGNGVAACEKGSTERASAPTAASVSVTGRILSSSGRGIANAVVAMTDPSGNTRFARTSTFGYYRFDDVQVGGTYIFTVSSKRYEFGATVRTITQETSNLNFVAP